MFGLGAIGWTIFGGRKLVAGAFKFLSTPLGQVVAVAGALVLTAVATDVHARIRDRAVCNGRIDELVATAAAAAKARDAEIAAAAERKIKPVVEGLQKQSIDLRKQVTTYERKLLAEKSGAACELGPDALQLRNQRPAAGPARPGDPRDLRKGARRGGVS